MAIWRSILEFIDVDMEGIYFHKRAPIKLFVVDLLVLPFIAIGIWAPSIRREMFIVSIVLGVAWTWGYAWRMYVYINSDAYKELVKLRDIGK